MVKNNPVVILPYFAAEKFYFDSKAHKRYGFLHCWSRFSVQIEYLYKTEMQHNPWCCFGNWGQLMNADISGAIYTLRIQY